MEASIDYKIIKNLSKFATLKSSKYSQSGEIIVKKLFQRCEIVVGFWGSVYKRD